jgi:hypothetical protein
VLSSVAVMQLRIRREQSQRTEGVRVVLHEQA